MKDFLTRYWLGLALALLAIVALVVLLSGGRTNHPEIKAAAKAGKVARARADSLLVVGRAAVLGSRSDSARAAAHYAVARGAAVQAAIIRHQTHVRHATPSIPRTRPDSARYYNRLFAD